MSGLLPSSVVTPATFFDLVERVTTIARSAHASATTAEVALGDALRHVRVEAPTLFTAAGAGVADDACAALGVSRLTIPPEAADSLLAARTAAGEALDQLRLLTSGPLRDAAKGLGLRTSELDGAVASVQAGVEQIQSLAQLEPGGRRGFATWRLQPAADAQHLKADFAMATSAVYPYQAAIDNAARMPEFAQSGYATLRPEFISRPFEAASEQLEVVHRYAARVADHPSLAAATSIDAPTTHLDPSSFPHNDTDAFLRLGDPTDALHASWLTHLEQTSEASLRDAVQSAREVEVRRAMGDAVQVTSEVDALARSRFGTAREDEILRAVESAGKMPE